MTAEKTRTRPARHDFSYFHELRVRFASIGASSITWQLAIFYHGDDECRSTGEIVWVCAKPGTHKSYPIPEQYRRKLS